MLYCQPTLGQLAMMNPQFLHSNARRRLAPWYAFWHLTGYQKTHDGKIDWRRDWLVMHERHLHHLHWRLWFSNEREGSSRKIQTQQDIVLTEHLNESLPFDSYAFSVSLSTWFSVVQDQRGTKLTFKNWVSVYTICHLFTQIATHLDSFVAQ